LVYVYSTDFKFQNLNTGTTFAVAQNMSQSQHLPIYSSYLSHTLFKPISKTYTFSTKRIVLVSLQILLCN